MKKLRLNKIFHWLYAVLMFLPFISTFLFVIVNFGTANDYFSANSICFDFLVTGIVGADSGTVGTAIADVFVYLIQDVLGFTDSDSILLQLPYLFAYWVCVSLVYLVFDVLMYLINLVHRWIDEGGF